VSACKAFLTVDYLSCDSMGFPRLFARFVM